MRKLIPALLIALFFSAALLSCSRVNNANYRKIEMGMKYAKIIEILGKPTKCSAVLSAKNCSWDNRNKSINIQFVGEQVVFFTSTGI